MRSDGWFFVGGWSQWWGFDVGSNACEKNTNARSEGSLGRGRGLTAIYQLLDDA